MKAKNAPYPLYDIPDILTFREFIDRCEGEHSGNTAFSFKRGKELVSKSYTDVKNEVRTAAAALIAKGLHQEKIAILGDNSYEWIIAYFSVVTSGNVVVPIDKQLPVEQVELILSETGAKLMFFSDTYSDYADEIKEKLPQIEVRSLQNNAAKEFSGRGCDTDCHIVYESVLVNPDDLAAIIYTSGTTGMAKGVMLTQKNLCMNAVGSGRCSKFPDKSILVLPLHHTYAFTVCVLLVMIWGSHIYINKNLKYFSSDLVEQKPCIAAVVPKILESFYNQIWLTAQEKKKEKQLKALMKISNCLYACGIDVRRKLFKSVLDAFGGELKIIISGGAPLEVQYVKDFRSFGIQIFQGYGITECSPVIAATRNDFYCDKSVGSKLPNFDIKINKISDNKEGEICAKGECVMQGYWNAPELTAEAFDEAGYFKTGDVGYIDDDGFVYVTGRVKNMIVRSDGKNVYPEELEFELMKNKAVKEVLVYEKDKAIVAEVFPDAEYITANGITDTEKYFADALDTLNRTLPLYKNINEIILRDTAFPKTTSMKIKRIQNNNGGASNA